MKRFDSVFLLIFLAGCVTIEHRTVSIVPVHESKINLTGIEQIVKGMDQEQVVELMRDALVIGYQQSDVVEGAVEPVRLNQPQRVENHRSLQGDVEVWFYFTNIFKADGLVSSEELTPVIFQEGIVIGKGRNDWERLTRGERLTATVSGR